jgi:AraC-like DNA-binding protein
VSRWLLGAPADELAGRHWALDDLWGAAAARMRERLLDAGSLERQLDLFEALLAARMPRLHALHPAVALALERLGAGALIGDIVRESGRSHRTFIALFRQAMGLSPKLYCRVQRLQRVIRRVAAEPAASWSDVALDAGYSDQPHLVREFRQLAGITPGEYRALAPRAHHVPLPAPAR